MIGAALFISLAEIAAKVRALPRDPATSQRRVARALSACYRAGSLAKERPASRDRAPIRVSHTTRLGLLRLLNYLVWLCLLGPAVHVSPNLVVNHGISSSGLRYHRGKRRI